jgi:hypothetical protein
MINSGGDGEDGCRMHFLYGEGNKEERREIGRSRCDKRMAVYINISVLGTLMMCMPPLQALQSEAEEYSANGRLCNVYRDLSGTVGVSFSAKRRPLWPFDSCLREGLRSIRKYIPVCVCNDTSYLSIGYLLLSTTLSAIRRRYFGTTA